MVEGIEAAFPRLAGTDYKVSSPRSEIYNCIAWAMGRTDEWCWPGDPARTYWPAGVVRMATVQAFQEAFTVLGYVVCPEEKLEPGFEKIALFADDEGIPKHAARQLPGGEWTSKLGQMEDIEHQLQDIAGTVYGSVVLVMKRSVQNVTGRKIEGKR